MFDLKSFIVTNIVNGVKNGTFTKEYANIMAVNYMLKGVITEEEIISISTQIEEWEQEQAQKAEISIDYDLNEENTDYSGNDAKSGEYEATDGILEDGEPIDGTDGGEPLT